MRLYIRKKKINKIHRKMNTTKKKKKLLLGENHEKFRFIEVKKTFLILLSIYVFDEWMNDIEENRQIQTDRMSKKKN